MTLSFTWPFNLQQSFEGQELSSPRGNAPIILILLDFFVLSSFIGRSLFFHFLYHIQVIQEFLDPKVVPQKVSLKIMNPDLQGLQVKTNLSLFYSIILMLSTLFCFSSLVLLEYQINGREFAIRAYALAWVR